MLWYPYFEKADATASIGTSEMLVIIKVDITQEPGVGKFLTSAIKPLIATQMPSCVEYNGKQMNLKKTSAELSIIYIINLYVYIIEKSDTY